MLLLFSLLLLPATSISAQPFAVIDETPSPASQCEILCRKVYGAAPEKLSLCREGCAQAERCTTGCAATFPDDEEEGERGRCNYRCARVR